MHIIEGFFKKDKTLEFKESFIVNQNENNSTSLHIHVPEDLIDNDFYVEFEIGIVKYITEKLLPNINGIIECLIPFAALRYRGMLSVQISAYNSNDKRLIKSFGGENIIEVLPSINAAEFILSSELSGISRLENSINNCIKAAEDVNELVDHINSIKYTELKGDKGDPSSLDKIGEISGTQLDMSDNELAIFGTLSNPLILNVAATISFINCEVATQKLKSFIVYIKRTNDIQIVWQDVIAWAYDEPPILPINKTQKIHIETEDGINFYGVAGDYFNV